MLPPPRVPGRYAVALVCLGNICRSPTAHVVLEQRLVEAGLDDQVVVHSSGTGDWHIGDPMDRRAAATLTAAGYDPSRHRARQYDASWVADLGGRSERIGMFRDHDPVEPGADVPDPYYGGTDGFAIVLEMVERTSDALVTALADRLDDRLAD